LLQALGIRVANCNHFAVGNRGECMDVLPAHHSRTNDCVPQRPVWYITRSGHASRVIATSFSEVSEPRLYFRQFLSGRDFARDNDLARQMVNFVYAIGDRETGECLLVDPAYDVDSLVDEVELDGMTVGGVLATHYHPDHVGGSMMGFRIDGIAALLERCSVPIHVQRAEVEWVTKVTGVGISSLVAHEPGDVVSAGHIAVTLLHTPGHTPGSQCFMVDGRLVSGDTLFLDGCGRTDLPGSNPDDMYDSLQTLASLPDDTVIFPGHQYSPAASGVMANIRRSNAIFKPKTKEAWLGWFGA
jgi:hydroxyacylglutathione hydrolase